MTYLTARCAKMEAQTKGVLLPVYPRYSRLIRAFLHVTQTIAATDNPTQCGWYFCLAVKKLHFYRIHNSYFWIFMQIKKQKEQQNTKSWEDEHTMNNTTTMRLTSSPSAKGGRAFDRGRLLLAGSLISPRPALFSITFPTSFFDWPSINSLW